MTIYPASEVSAAFGARATLRRAAICSSARSAALAVVLIAVAGCRPADAPLPKSGTSTSCGAFSPEKTPAERAEAAVAVLKSLQNNPLLELRGIDAGGAVVFVPKHICTPPIKITGLNEALLAVQHADYASTACGDPPIVIHHACMDH